MRARKRRGKLLQLDAQNLRDIAAAVRRGDSAPVGDGVHDVIIYDHKDRPINVRVRYHGGAVTVLTVDMHVDQGKANRWRES